MGAICCITNRKDEEERKKKIEDRKKLEEEDYPQPKITINEHLDENNNSIRHERRLMRDKKSKTMRNYRSQDSKRDSFSYAELNSNPSNIMDLFCKNFDEKTMVVYIYIYIFYIYI